MEPNPDDLKAIRILSVDDHSADRQLPVDLSFRDPTAAIK